MGKKKNVGTMACSACRQLTNNPQLHDLLKVPICENCYGHYHNGDFELSEDTRNEKYCRWCGEVKLFPFVSSFLSNLSFLG
jgi:hypothetical protein